MLTVAGETLTETDDGVEDEELLDDEDVEPPPPQLTRNRAAESNVILAVEALRFRISPLRTHLGKQYICAIFG